MDHLQTLNSDWRPNLNVLLSLSKFAPWTPKVVVEMFLNKKPGNL